MEQKPGSKYRLEDLIDIKHFQELQDRLNEIYSFPSSIIDNDGNILTATAWQDICIKFHRKNRECEKACIASDKYIKEHLGEANPAVTYKCPHGLVDNATPIIIAGIHFGNFFTGQFFLEAPDMEFFRTQAIKYGFPVEPYLEAVKNVPVWSREQLNSYLFFIKGLIAIISESGLKNLKEIETKGQLKESEEKYRQLFEAMRDAYASTNMEGRIIGSNTAFSEMLGYTSEELEKLTYNDLTPEKWHRFELDILEKQVLPRGYSNIYEKEYIHKNGTFFPVELRTFLIKDRNGNTAGMWAIVRDISERKRAEESLIEREELLNKSQEMASLGSFVWDMVTNKVTWSHNLYKIYGYDEDSFTGNILEVSNQLIHPDDAERANQEIKEMIEKTSKWDAEFRIIRPDGEVRNIRSKGEVELDANGKQVKCFGINQDITERKQAEIERESALAALNKSDKFLNEAQRVSGLGCFEWVVSEEHVLWSDEEYRIFGVPDNKSRLTLPEIIEFVHPEERTDIWQKIHRALAGEIPYVFENRIIRPNGEVRHILTNAEVQSDIDGKPIRIIGTTLDITGRKQAEESLIKSEEKHRTILQTAIDGFLIIDRDGNLVEVNEAYCKISGYTREELLSMHAGDLEIPGTSVEIDKKINEIIDKKTQRFIRKHRRKDGTVFDVEISSQYLQEDESFVCFIRDITKIKEMETQLHQAQKMESIGTLAGGIAHDFNNILSPIMMHAEMGMDELPPDHPMQLSMKEIFRASERARDLVKQILTFARKTPEKRVLLQPSLIIKEAIRFLRSTIPTTIHIQYEIKSEKDVVLADPTQLNQIVMNLCTNAAHAMKEKGGVLTVILDHEEISPLQTSRFLNLKPGQYVKLTVRDTGTGIPPDIIGRIFEPYFTTKKVGEGTGLGLATVHGIVLNYGGDITVESNIGSGTAFHVYIPSVEMEISGAESEMRPEIKKGSEHILFVDDEKAAVDVSMKMFVRYGYRVTGMIDSKSAFEEFRRNPDKYEMLITDMTMPDMTGDVLAQEILSIKPGLPVILCTGFSDKINEETAKRAGIKAFVMKPIVMKELVKTIREIFDRG